MKDTVRLNFDFPKSHYPYLKLLCAKKGTTFKDLATEMLIEAIEKAEDEMLLEKAEKRLKKQKAEDLISWEAAKKLAGWDE